MSRDCGFRRQLGHLSTTAFGGDPDNVTLFGQSAGSYSTCAHLVAPSSAGLFDRVISQSGPDATLDAADYRTRLEEAYGKEKAAAVVARYPASAHDDTPALTLAH